MSFYFFKEFHVMKKEQRLLQVWYLNVHFADISSKAFSLFLCYEVNKDSEMLFTNQAILWVESVI